MSKFPYFCLLLLLSPSMLAVKYRVVNTVPTHPGGRLFDKEIGIPFTLQKMKIINSIIWKIFKQNTEAQRKRVPILTVIITELSDGARGETGQDNVYISAEGLLHPSPPGQYKNWSTSLLCHEMTHVFQWSGQGTAPGGLTEGIAEYVKVKSNYYDPISFTRRGEGNRWDEGYGVTARFLEYCDSLRDGFTADLNNKMGEVYKDKYFQDLLGKSLEQVWRDYKAKYGK